MPERFDELLAELVDTTARATRAPGAEAARRRGRQRRNRLRLGAGVLSVALLGGAGAVAAVSLGAGPQHTPTGYAATATGSPQMPPATATPPNPTGSPLPGFATRTANPAPHTTGAPGPTGSENTQTPANPHTLVPGAWIGAAGLPFGSGDGGGWQTVTASLGGGTTALGDSVFAGSPLESCTDLMGTTALAPLGREASEQVREFDGTGDFSVGGRAVPAYAQQQILFYPDAATALSAWGSLAADFDACKAQMTGVSPTTGTAQYGSVQQTLNQPDAQCWSTLATNTNTNTQPSSDGDLIHFCFVRSGALLTVVDVDVHQDGSFSTVGFGSIDQQLTAELRQALAAFGTRG